MRSASRFKFAYVFVPLAFAAIIALAALSYFATRATIAVGPTFAAPGTSQAGKALVVEWRTGTDIAIIASFTPSRFVRVRSVTLTGLDPKNAFIASSQYGFWDGQTSLPSFTSEADPLPPEFGPRALVGAFAAPAHSSVFVKLLVRAISDANVTQVLTGIRVDAESWSWAHTTFIPFQQPVKLEPPH
ncbi:MAG TPA: hypothetical protein VKV69_00485 [Actinomycetota bacterium]|nr:hypothetical protein [Actinomycetota bacterium]